VTETAGQKRIHTRFSMGCQDNQVSIMRLGRFDNDACGVAPEYIRTGIVSLVQQVAEALLDEFFSTPDG
jgi:hypothetical protein